MTNPKVKAAKGKPKKGSAKTTVKPALSIIKVLPSKNYRQYVNMAQGANPTHHGRNIIITAEVKPKKQGITVYWTLEEPRPPKTSNRAGLAADKRAKLSSSSSSTEADGIAEVTLTPSVYGGDRFRVGASLLSGKRPKKHSGWFRVYQKLYYDIAEMKTKDGTSKYALPVALQNRIKAGFKKAFIELKDTGKRHLGDYKDNFDTVEKGFQWGDTYCAGNGVPQKVHFCVIDTTAPRSGTSGATTETVEEEADTTPFTSSGKIRPYDFTGHNWLIKAQYETYTSGFFGQLTKEWKDFAPGKVTLVGTRGRRKFKVDFSGSERTPSAGNKVKVRIQYLQPGSYGGWGGSNCLHLLICRGEYEDLMTRAEADRQIIVACLHEVGHAIGLVDASAAWHDAPHRGHCKFNSCTMWHASSPGNEAFHYETTSDPGCRTFVRETELTKGELQSKWKFPR